MCKAVYLLLFVATVYCQNREMAPGIRRDLLNAPCMLDDGSTGECLTKYRCRDGSVNSDGEAIINIRFLNDGPCGSILLVCCSLDDKRPEPVTPKPAPRPEGCGWINPKGADMRTTGETGGETKFGEIPWMVAILDTERKLDQWPGYMRVPAVMNINGSRYWKVSDLKHPEYLSNLKMKFNLLRCGGQMTVTDIQPHLCGPVIANPGLISVSLRCNRDNATMMMMILCIFCPASGSPRGLPQYIGGGSLIHPSAVLTAAHIVYTKRSLRIRAGEWDPQTAQELYPHQERNVASMIIHNDYFPGILFYDAALLFLQTPVVLAPHIGVACLPPAQPTPAGTRCTATGWGKQRFEKEDQYSVILKKIEVPVVDRTTCQAALRRTRLGAIFELHSSFMCAGGENDKDTCKGDGGSPLSCPMEYEPDRYMQSGIVAWGIGCGEDGTPGVYVDVSKIRNWIDDKMAGKGYVLDTY